jgi:hypothetical protein
MIVPVVELPLIIPFTAQFTPVSGCPALEMNVATCSVPPVGTANWIVGVGAMLTLMSLVTVIVALPLFEVSN